MQNKVTQNFKPHHFDATKSDFIGNGKIGRYVIVPGSKKRAEDIAKKYFKNLVVKESDRGHNLYLGNLDINGKKIDVATISTGMGTPSVDLILTELILLGAKRFIRVGTSGSFQKHVKLGDVVFATSAVRDEATSANYVPREFPAVANQDMSNAAWKLAQKDKSNTHLGTVHSKDSLYAREFLLGPMKEEHKKYTNMMKAFNVLCSEMETSHIYVLSQVYTAELKEEIKSGSVLAVISDGESFHADPTLVKKGIENAIQFTIDLIAEMAKIEIA